MKKFLAILLLPVLALSLTLSINSGTDDGKPYSVITLSDENKFECVEQILAYNTKRFACMIDDDGMVNIDDVDLALMDIRYKKQDGKLFIIVLPKANSRLLNLENKLHENSEIFKNNSRISKRFSIVIDPKLSEFDKNAQNGINFAPKFDELLLPSIGALDFSKAPMEAMDSNDIDLYINIKQAYEASNFNRVLAETKSAITRHPNSIFSSEFLLYRLRAMGKALENEEDAIDIDFDHTNIVEEGKAWMRKFASDENYPEVLYLVTRAYIKQNLNSDAKYTVDLLKTEHTKSKFSKLAMLDYADEIYKNSGQKEATGLYEYVLYNTDDIDIASRAALSLASANIEKDRIEEAKNYIIKILNANQKFFLANQPKAMDLAKIFDERNMHDIASKIYEIIANDDSAKSEFYEVALKNLGIALADDNQTQKAYDYLKRYEKEFKDGDYLAEVQRTIDRLFFDLGETNSTKLYEYYDLLMQKYDKSDIGIKALASAVELNFNEKRYKQALEFTQQAKDLNLTASMDIINRSALALAQQGVRDNDCQIVINLLEAYDINTLELPQFKLHDCLKRTARHEKALNLAKSHIQDKNLEDRVEWLVKLAADLRQLKMYEDSVNAANDALSLGASVPYADPTPALYDRFYSLIKLNRLNDAIRTMGAIEELRGQDFKIIESFDALAKFAFSKSDYANTTTYAKKALELANSVRINVFTPDLNFLYSHASLKMGNLADALDEAKYILNLKLKPLERSRALNLMADIHIARKEPNEARKYLNECINSNIDNEFVSLCKASLELLK
ncbi:hypothetical protein U5B43_09180 [Campylobacter sp. 9BO]|uniref:tetratricopeptide repeat protein n=1 Tax=Campylobacter sp. 9BO TaxID=3424759 RepID=UPI003D3391B5